MIIDQLQVFSDSQAVTATAYSDKSIDLLAAQDLGVGNNLYVVFNMEEAAASGGSTTVDFQLVHSANANLTSHTVIAEKSGVAKATLADGYGFSMKWPDLADLDKGARYIGVRYVVNTANLTAGKITAYLSPHGATNRKIHASGFSTTV